MTQEQRESLLLSQLQAMEEHNSSLVDRIATLRDLLAKSDLRNIEAGVRLMKRTMLCILMTVVGFALGTGFEEWLLRR